MRLGAFIFLLAISLNLIVSNISAIVYQNDVPVAVGNVGGKEAISLKEAKENYEEVKETWERLTDQKGITWDKDLQKAMQDTINKARAMQKGQELER